MTDSFKDENITQNPKYELLRIINNAMEAIERYIVERDEDLINAAYFELQLAIELLAKEGVISAYTIVRDQGHYV